jgi:hypothetical protein
MPIKSHSIFKNMKMLTKKLSYYNMLACMKIWKNT